MLSGRICGIFEIATLENLVVVLMLLAKERFLEQNCIITD